MAAPSAQRIVIDESVLKAQTASLAEAATVLRSSAATASGGIGAGAFGLLCGTLLAPAISGLAAHSGEISTTAAQIAERASRAVDATMRRFSSTEDAAIAALRKASEGEAGQ